MSKLDELLSKMQVEEYGITPKSETKAQIKALVLELLDESAKEAHSGSQHVEIFRQKVEAL